MGAVARAAVALAVARAVAAVAVAEVVRAAAAVAERVREAERVGEVAVEKAVAAVEKAVAALERVVERAAPPHRTRAVRPHTSLACPRRTYGSNRLLGRPSKRGACLRTPK